MICTIRNNTITLDDAVFFTAPESSFADFAKKALKALNVEYPKFFKMDNPSKLAFLAAEAALSPPSTEAKSRTVLLFANRAASLDTDLKHQAIIANPQEYYPSPAVFVYTLPNICLGEISIRHQLHTEGSLFVFDSHQQAAPFLQTYSQALLDQGVAEHVPTGWVDFLGEEYEAICQRITLT